MITVVGDVMLGCMHWAEGCCCHRDDGRPQSRAMRVRRFQRTYGVELNGCPMRTRRAPEMASGSMPRLLADLFQHGSQLLLLSPEIAALDAEHRARVLREFGRARQHLRMTFAVKFSHWRQLPWICLGIAHPDRGVAEACGERALGLFATASPEVRAHPIVALLCDPASPTSAELRRFVYDNTDLGVLPVLRRICGKFLFIPIAERWVESQHAAAKKHLQGAPHYSCIHLAFRSIQTRLGQMFRADPEAVFRFARHCQEVKNPRKCLVRMKFWMHPAVQRRLQQQGGSVRAFGRSLRRWVVDLLYHVDIETVFQVRGLIPNAQRSRVLVHLAV